MHIEIAINPRVCTLENQINQLFLAFFLLFASISIKQLTLQIIGFLVFTSNAMIIVSMNK